MAKINSWTGIVLAAGAGKRMGNNPTTKVMQEIASLPMLGWVLNNLSAAKPEKIILVLPPNMKEVSEFAKTLLPKIEIVEQKKPLGTADAVRTALPKIKTQKVVIAYGDTPLVKTATYKKLAQAKSDLVLTGFQGNKIGYGRIIYEKGFIKEIKEDDGKKSLGEGYLNGGLMALNVKTYKPLLAKLKNNNPKKEFYLTDLASFENKNKSLIICDEEELLGANNLLELSVLESAIQNRLRQKMLAAGVKMLAPETIFFASDTEIEAGVQLAPYIVFGAGVKIKKNVRIESFSHIAGAVIGKNAVVGPFSRLRPDTHLGEGSFIGNFVEVKKTKFGAKSKANHLTYLGDAVIGKNVNIGAGTITCNYDGKEKHQTDIFDDAFIGSNSALVAPVKISKGAYIGSGSVITKNVPPGNLAIARTPQKNINKRKK